jgi:hypothetical protein
MEILRLPWSHHCPLVGTPQLNCRASYLQHNSFAWTTQKIQPFYWCRGVFTRLLHSSGQGMDHIENTVLLLLHALPSNGHCLQSHCLAMGCKGNTKKGKMNCSCLNWNHPSYSQRMLHRLQDPHSSESVITQLILNLNKWQSRSQ